MNTPSHLHLRVFSADAIDKIHAAVLRLLRKQGVNVQDQKTRKQLIKSGCRESPDGLVLFDTDLINSVLEKVPGNVMFFDRNGQVALDTGGGDLKFAPGLNCVDVLDYKTDKVRPCLLKDVVETARVCDALPNIHMAANLGNPSDVTFEDQARAAVQALIENTRKPIMFIAHDDIEAAKIWGYLAEVAGGWEVLSAKPWGLDLTGPTSPLTIKPEACRRLVFAAHKQLPVVCYPCLFPGISGPMTLAGAIAQSSAEVLAGIVIHQTACPGAPVISGSAVVPMDMRTVTLAYGAPEYALVSLAAIDYLQAIGIPTWIGAGCSDAHRLDAQAISEATMNMTAAALSGTSFVHNLGYLSSGKIGSLELLVLCNELAGMAQQLRTGISVNTDTIALDTIIDRSKNGKFLTHPHTKKHVRNALWIPSLFQRFGRSRWQESGASTTAMRIKERLQEILH